MFNMVKCGVTYISFLTPFWLEASSENTSLACDVALCCLEKADLLSRDHKDHLNMLAALMCPLLLILPKVVLLLVNTVVLVSFLSILGPVTGFCFIFSSFLYY